MQEFKEIDSNYILSSTAELNFSSKSNTTNTSSSSNSLAFNEDEDDEYCSTKAEMIDDYDSILRAATSSSSANSLTHNNLITNSSQLITSLTSSLIRTNPSSSSSSTTSSTNGNHHDHNEIIHSQNNKYIFLLDAFVNGFAQLKICADKSDYEYIIEIYWSNETKSYIKRTYDDFVSFHRQLIEMFSQFFEQIKSNVNNKAITKNNSIKKPNHFIQNSEYLMPVLPASKKPFWVSHLKLAESREIELNSYVQRVLKLPTKISHSQLVLKFFESQSSDPKPAKQQHKFSPQQTSPSDELQTLNHFDQVYRDSDLSENQLDDFAENHSENENSSNYEYDDEDDYEGEDQYPNQLESTKNYNNLPISNSMIGLNHIPKKNSTMNRECLWWDEDEALNELTSSMSFDFSSHNQYSKNNFEENDDGTEDLETLKTLEKILKNSDLFRSETKDNSISSISTTMLQFNSNDNQIKRLSLS